MIKELLTERLRPKKFEHLILPKRIKDQLGSGTITQNLLLYGSPGTGKTSAAKVLAAKYAFDYINVSDESSVEVVRNRITDFCSTQSVIGFDLDEKQTYQHTKVVILDEMDGASDQFFKALRGTIEKFAKNARFIGTANYINKVPDAIQSRFELVNFDFVNKAEEDEVRTEWESRIPLIMNKLGIEPDNAAVIDFIERYFPDMRTALNRLQSFQVQNINKLTSEKVKESSWDFEELYDVMIGQPDPISNYEYVVSNYSSMVDDVMSALGNDFVFWIKDKHKNKITCIPQIIIEVAKHQAQRNVVIDPIVSLLSLVFTIQAKLNA